MNQRAMKYLVGAVAAVALFASAQASATLINFENAPSKGLSDNDGVTNQWAGDGVTFGGAYLEKTGGGDRNPQGFLNDVTGKYDSPAPGYAPATGATGAGSYGLGLGTWFLRSGGSILSRGDHGIYLTVVYTTPVSAASGQIWDIDGHPRTSQLPLRSEQWNVVAYSGGVEVASITSPLGISTSKNSLNAKPWTFNLSYSGGFDSIEFEFIGTKTRNIGLAFDNFNTDSLVAVPEPAALGMFGLGVLLIGGFVALRRREQHRV